MFRRLRPDLSSLRWKIAALAAVTACLVVAAVGVLVHMWTVDDIRSRAEAQAFNRLYSAMETYRRTGTLADGAELDPAELPLALRHPPTASGIRLTTGASRGIRAPASGPPSGSTARAAGCWRCRST